jgi:outer membrane protein assembly factor BamA
LRSAPWWLLAGILAHGALRAQATDADQPQGLMRWLNPSTAPFIPVPEIDVDPNSGTTLGLIPTWISTDDKDQVRRIIAPDIIHNPYFGVGARARMYSFTSDDTQWSAVAGAKQRVESEFDFEYETGRLRDTPLSFNASVVYDRSGTARFYGIGNSTPTAARSNYTFQQMFAQATLAWNLTHTFRIAYLLRARSADVQQGTLAGIPSIYSGFAAVDGLGTQHETLNRIALIGDTRDDSTVPTRGGEYAIYGGIAARQGVFNASLYSVAGVDLRQLWSITHDSILAAHASLRYMPGKSNVPFWSLSNLGGDESVLGEAQPLRGFGSGRFYDRNSFSASLEYRKRVLGIDAVSTHINVEITPFIDVGEVYAHSRSSPLGHLHHVGGIGFRGVASPFVVGYVDIGYGSEGIAAFTGINYPF